MNDKEFDDFLRQQLQHSSDYLDDGDFSAKVMASLPAPKRLNPWLERLIILLPVTLIAVLVLRQFPLRDLIQPAYAWLLTVDMPTLVSAAAVIFVLMVVVPAMLIFKPKTIF